MRSVKQAVVKGLLAMGLTFVGSGAWALKCDVDNNGRIDRVDIGLIQQAIVAKSPVTGPEDPRDADDNNVINAVDSRICTLRCRYASCAVNGTPVADAGPDSTVRVGERVTLNGAASSDPDGNALTYAWSFTSRPAGSAAALTGATSINPSFTADRPGSYVLQLVVNDGTVSSTADSVTISTSNSAPVANAGADQTARVGDTVVLDGRGSNDVDGDTLSYAWRIVSAPAGSSSVLSNAAVVQPSLRLDVSGTYELQLVVNDGSVNSAADTVIVSTTNSAPVARPGSNQSVALGALVQLNGSGSSDVDGNPLTYAWSLLSRPAGSSAALSNAGLVNPTFTADRPGTYVAQLIVNDGFTNSAAASVTISTDNAAPTANAGADQTVPLGATVQLSGGASTDPEGTALAYTWALTTRPAGSTAALSGVNLVAPSFVADRPGTYVAQLIVSDGVLSSAPDTIIVSTQNSRPVADAGAPQSVETGSTVQLNGSGSRDADGNPLTYSWSLTTRPAGSVAVLANATSINPSFVADLAGSYVAQLIVSDGSLASAPVTVLITVTTTNRAPTAAASANPTTVNVGSSVSLSSAGSSDPDGNPITYAWSVALRPSGSVAAISNATASTAGFTPDVAGAYTFQLTVSDGSLSASATASITANAVVTNRPPVIVTAAPTAATVGAPYVYDVDATDPDAGSTLVYSLTVAPAGMAINPATGLISWTPTPAQLGAQSVTVRVADAGGLSASQSFTVTVSGAATPLQLAATLTPAIANAGETVTLTVLVSGGNGGAVTRTATLDGVPLVLNGAGVASFAAPATGVHRVLARAESAPVNGNAPAPQVREFILTVRDASDTTAPVAAITSPAANSEVLSPVPVIGTATDARFAYYQLLLRPAGSGSSAWTEIYRGLSAVSNAALGTLDPSRIANGVYELGLNVVDVNGRATSTVVPIEVSRDRKMGQVKLSFTDIRVDASGMPLTLTRSYDSLKKDVLGDFGWGWSADSQDVSVRKNMVFGQQWVVTTSGFNICLRPVGQRRITVTMPDGGVYRFQARNQPECAFAQVPEVNIVLDPLPLPVGGGAGSAAGAGVLEVIVTDSILAQGGNIYNADTGDYWNPTDFRFTDAQGVRHTLREGVGVVSKTDRYGNTITYGPGGAQHSATLGLQLVRDAQGRITRATDPSGRSLNYAYNAAGELASVTDRASQVTYFQYDTATHQPGTGDAGSVNSAHLLASITDPSGQVVLRQQFDEYGRLVAKADGNGVSATQTFDEANNQQRVVDRRGNPTTYTFDAAGNVTRIVDARGGTFDLSYDANGNELTRRDPLGNVTTKTYNAVSGKVLTESDPLGRVTTTAYPTTGRDSERQNPVSVTDPMGRVTSFGYLAGDSTFPGAMPNSVTEPLGRVTTFGMDARGNVTSVNAAGIVSSYAYDTRGRRIRETDGLGAVTDLTYDDAGNELTRTVTRTVNGVARTETITRVYDGENRITQETDATGAVRRTSYHPTGQIATTTDAIGRVTRFTYDANSRLTRTEFADGSRTETEYDANGNRISTTDRLGRVTRMSYDELNRLVLTQNPDGSSRSREYDAAGRLTAEVDERGARRVNEYDAAGQLTASIDASGRRTEHTYDAAGNITQTRLPGGRAINFSFDALNRLTRIDYPDGSAHASTYRPDGRKATETDARGVLTTYGYDANGRLVSVIQSGVASATTYGYDETGAKTLQRDAAGRQVQWRFDAAGRIVSRSLPDGSVETFAYDAQGQLTGYTNFGGVTVTHTYDSQGREVTRSIPASAGAPARSISWTYTAEGLPATQTETGSSSSQGVTSYTYDTKGQLLQMVTPQGTLSWVYDPAGRIVQRSTAEGSTGYLYDGDGRLTQLTAPDGNVTTYAYDAAGRLVHSEQALGAAGSGISLVTDKRYDAQDRELAIAYSRRSGAGTTMLGGQSITRGTGGAITRIDTFGPAAAYDAVTGSFTGTPVRVKTFGYDANARLTGENNYRGAELTAWLANGTSPATQAIGYAYDSVGNRTSKTVTTPSGTESTAYAYDSTDRLLSETLTTATGSTVNTTYTWGSNGALASKQSPGEYTGYTFDAENRLISVQRGTSPATATVVASYGYDAKGQRISKTTAAGTTRFLIDPTTLWAQVALESTATDRTAYVWADGLRQQTRGGQGTLFGSPTDSVVPLAGHLGTPIAAINADGSIAEQYDISAYGEVDVGAARLNNLYAGEHWDADSQLVYLRARWYDPKTGRFISADPAEGLQKDPHSLHRYNYANGDPVQTVDRSGKFGLLASMDASVTNALSSVSAAFRLGSAVGGAALRNLGMVVEAQVERLLVSRFGAAAVQNGIRLEGAGGTRVIDFLVRLGDRLTFLEVKYGLPRKAGAALTRLVGQMRTATTAGAELAAAEGATSEVVLFTWAAPTEAQMALVLAELGETASSVRIVSGFVNLNSYLWRFFLGI
ncbi:MAG TPA: PKD domain-containing protein [Rhizobacter sp.]|nr:PKD domain-containing protein [Rhizobacter sp.]